MARYILLILALGVLGCADSGRATVDSGSRDSGGTDSSSSDSGGSDSGSIDTGTTDTGTTDTGSSDTGTSDTSAGDGGGGGIVVDGVIAAGEWASAAEATNGETSTWGATNTFTRILATVRGGTFYLAVEGQLESGAENALVVFVDNERGSGTGVTDPIDLTDGSGALDNSVSAGITTPADVQVDFAWGTRDLDRSQDGFDDRMGWRDVATDPSDFAWLDAAEAPTVCGAAACETSIPLSSLGGAGDIALFGRLVNTDGTMASNQCVPEDDPDTPTAVSILLTVTR
jgi:hypothetical protein